jgi:hypothetical protein
MPNLKLYKVNSLPGALEPHSMYLVPGTGSSDLTITVTNAAGDAYRSISTDISSNKIDWSLDGYIAGGVPSNSTIMLTATNRDTTLPINCPGSHFYSVTPPTDVVVFDIKKSSSPYAADTTVGTITFATGSETGTIAVGSTHTLTSGDHLFISSPNDTFGMRDVYMNVLGYTLMPIHP